MILWEGSITPVNVVQRPTFITPDKITPTCYLPKAGEWKLMVDTVRLLKRILWVALVTNAVQCMILVWVLLHIR